MNSLNHRHRPGPTLRAIVIGALLAAGTLSPALRAAEPDTGERIARSTGGFTRAATDNGDGLSGDATLTRKAPLAVTGVRSFTPSTGAVYGTPHDHSTRDGTTHAFRIYDARSALLHDSDGDGFFHYFSVSFDADVSSGSAFVYAELYLSLNGGPWNHYYTTEVFVIEGESGLDEYTVTTSLDVGYPTGYYDILIELYEPGWPDMVAAYGPYDDYALSALPLEDSDHDPVIDYYIGYESGGCSLAAGTRTDPVLPALIALAMVYIVRRRTGARGR